MSGAHRAVWNGPAHTSSTPTPVIANDSFGKQKEWLISKYADDREINTAIPNYRRLTVVRLDKKGDFDLEIVNASSSDEGLYKCDIDPVEGIFSSKLYIIQLKALPSNLTIDNETHKDTVIGTEYQTLKLACNVESGIPPETIIWKRNRIALKIGGPKRNVYEFQLGRTDHNSNLTCEVTNNLMKIPLTKTVKLDIKYKPRVLISHEQTKPVVEGSTKTLCCEIDSNPNNSFMYWYKNHKSQMFNRHSFCLIFNQLTRKDSGNYTCLAGNEIGNGSFTVSLVVLYPPSVYLMYNNKYIRGNKRYVTCKGDGLPNTLTFFRVAHKSLFNEHIRYIEVSSDGIATLPPMEASDRYQDTGLYVCNASNDVPDREGNKFQQGKAFLVSDAPPVFVADNKKIQYGEIGKPMDIIVKVYSTSEIKCLNLNAIGSLNIKDIMKKSVPLKINFHGVNITANGIEVTFRLVKLHGIRWFNITVCNNFSMSSFILEVRKSGKKHEQGIE
ncbi:unnamed protein product [Mytilus coruscus]|uniref:Ig-like domain-containing protein n=1 Tax=Mytilus coruscus TaxID=42192 RepID=A0A6J8B973_MYTCO|nr:unnamed protein product [Mytilus coruscus]